MISNPILESLGDLRSEKLKGDYVKAICRSRLRKTVTELIG
jgi:hypothetical protein